MKYFYQPFVERKRVILPDHAVQEMHRNTRIDPYEDALAEKLKASLSFQDLCRYPDVETFQNKLARFVDLSPEHLLITSGIDGALHTLFEMCTQPNSQVLYLTPTYMMYPILADAFRLKATTVHSRADLTVSVDEILERITPQLDLVLIPNPHEPIEHVFTLDEIETLAKATAQVGALLMIDEAYYMFGAPTAIRLISKYPSLAVSRTFSKGFGLPSIRLGYIAAHPELIRYLSSRRLAHESNSLSLGVAGWALDNLDYFQSYVNEVIETRKWLTAELNQRGFATHGQQSNTFLINLETPQRAQSVTKHLKAEDIWIKGGLVPPAESWVSVTLGSRFRVERFLQAFLRCVATTL